jgi:hypothetical protein
VRSWSAAAPSTRRASGEAVRIAKSPSLFLYSFRASTAA